MLDLDALDKLAADDAAAVTTSWAESIGFDDACSFRDSKRFEICHGIRLICSACAGPKCWNVELWIVGGSSMKIIKDPTRAAVRSICAALGITLNEPTRPTYAELIAEVRRLREDANPIRLMERVRRFKRMSRYMATLTWPNLDTFERACGDVLCHGCGLPYFDHPSKDDLHLDCQGRLWKL